MVSAKKIFDLNDECRAGIGGVKAKYFRLTALGNSAGSSNSYTEVRFYTSEAQLEEDRQYWPTYFAEYDAMATVGQTVQILASGVTAEGEEKPVSDLVYSSDNASVATVDANGMITFVAAGTANITVQYDSAFGSIKKAFLLNVNKQTKSEVLMNFAFCLLKSRGVEPHRPYTC